MGHVDPKILRALQTSMPKTPPNIDFHIKRDRYHSAGPDITDREIAAAAEAAANGWYSNYRRHIERFEDAFREYLGVKYALATSSGTAALHLCLAAAGIGPGDEVIVPDITWVATGNVVRLLGAEPVCVDVLSENWTIDPSKIEERITEKTKAIFPVHLYGHPADMDVINAIAKKHGLLVIEDAAPAVASTYKDRKAGTMGLAAGFSFQGAKLMVTGQGGMLVTDDKTLYDRAVSLIEHGREPEHGVFYSGKVGYNYKMPAMCAAMGTVQLERLDQLVMKKRRQQHYYQQRLGHRDEISFVVEQPGSYVNFAYPSVMINSAAITRDLLFSRLRERNIDSRPSFPRQSAMPNFADADTPVSRDIEENGWNLPTAFYFDEDDMDYICTSIEECLDDA